MSCVAAENCGTYGRAEEADAEDEVVGPEPGVTFGVDGFDVG